MKAAIRYFTGTGNTARALSIIAAELEAGGWEVESAEIGGAGSGAGGQSSGAGSPSSPDTGSDLLILGHPTLGFMVPSTFARWLRKLPKGEGRAAATVSACGGMFVGGKIVPGNSGWSSRAMARVLRRKGYRVLGSWEVSLPVNWTQVMDSPTDEGTLAILGAADAQCREIGRSLAKLEGTELGKPAISLAVYRAVGALFLLLPRRILGKLYVADGQCTGCGLCARTCPARTITMRGSASQGQSSIPGRSSVPAWGCNCSACNRCINLCPFEAIQTSQARLACHLGFTFAATVASVALALAPFAGFGLAGPPSVPVRIAVAVTAYAFFVVVELCPFDWLLGLIERTGPGSRLFRRNRSDRFRRYLAPGFRPKL